MNPLLLKRLPARPSRARVLMIQGTASYVGKSMVVAALCRLFARRGFRVAPFKAQNISLNASVTPDGGEIGVAQAVQAQAAGVAPSVKMNPILVKPEPGGRAQVVVLGRAVSRPGALHPARRPPGRQALWRVITRSLDALRAAHDLVIIEGAGSPAEINLRRRDLTNMRVARYADAPVVIVGDIDRGGVFAAFVGTIALLEKEERALVGGFLINKFRGRPGALRRGVRMLEARTGRPVLGVLPHAPALRIPEEDAVALEVPPEQSERRSDGELDVAVVELPSISNFDEFDALERERSVRVRYVRPGGRLGHPDLLILPGSKSTVADLGVLRRSGLAEDVRALAARGVPVLGICGGYQMLGTRILDPEHVESARAAVRGLGLLPAATTFGRVKRTARVRASLLALPQNGIAAALPSLEMDGYEIHMGHTEAQGIPFMRVVRRGRMPCGEPDGVVSEDGMVFGTSIHGLFRSEPFRRAFLDALRSRRETRRPDLRAAPALEEILDGLADLVSRHLDLRRLERIIGIS